MTTTIDFETEAIEGNPIANPPRPIGVAVKVDGLTSAYYTASAMRRRLKPYWHGDEELIFHNAPFDLSVAEKWLGLAPPPWDRVHDTQLMLYLNDPHAESLGLKQSAGKLLDMGNDDQDALHNWIMLNVKEAKKSNAGAFISRAPRALVSKYARMDVDMTWALYDHLKDRIPRDAYDVERELQPYLTQATVKGIRVDVDGLGLATSGAEQSLACAEALIRERLDAPDLDVHNGNQLADALDRAGVIKEWSYTPTGKRSTARAKLLKSVTDQGLLDLLSYAGAIRTCYRTFMTPWLELARGTGRLHPSWNQVRNDSYGTRTGRLSCSGPNLQNVPTTFFNVKPPPHCIPIPNMRDFLLPEEGEQWVSRDFSAQEMRILAHYAGGALADGFREDPDMDPHAMVQRLIKEQTGKEISRKPVKNIGFGIMYGMGTAGLASQMGVSVDEANDLIGAYRVALPGVIALQTGTQERGRYADRRAQVEHYKAALIRARDKEMAEERIRAYEKRLEIAMTRMPPCDYVETLGGRQYAVEAPQITEEGKKRTFEYKLLNYLIQGSAADQTKASLLHWFKHKPAHHTFLATVHDEINISVPMGGTDSELKESMEREAGLSVPMRTTVATGATWGSIE